MADKPAVVDRIAAEAVDMAAEAVDKAAEVVDKAAEVVDKVAAEAVDRIAAEAVDKAAEAVDKAAAADKVAVVAVVAVEKIAEVARHLPLRTDPGRALVHSRRTDSTLGCLPFWYHNYCNRP